MPKPVTVSNATISLCIALLHAGAVLSTIGSPDISAILGFPCFPLAIALLERFDPRWANYSGTNPLVAWAAIFSIWVGNFAFYMVASWTVVSWLRARPSRRSVVGPTVASGDSDGATGASFH